MKKKVIYRIIGIGLFHMVLYLYVVPFMIYPKFGDNGFKFAVAIAIIVSLAALGTIFFERKIKGDKND
jgi:ABC-type sulfate transport system permease component